jgi:hypothetical protein
VKQPEGWEKPKGLDLAFEVTGLALEGLFLVGGCAKDPLYAVEIADVAASLATEYTDEGKKDLRLHSVGRTTARACGGMTLASERSFAATAPFASMTGFASAYVSAGVSAGLSAVVSASMFGGVSAEVLSLHSASLVSRRGLAEVVGKRIEIGATEPSLLQKSTEHVAIEASKSIELRTTHAVALSLHEKVASCLADTVSVTSKDVSIVSESSATLSAAAGGSVSLQVAGGATQYPAYVAAKAANDAAKAAAKAARDAADELESLSAGISIITYLDTLQAAVLTEEAARKAADKLAEAARQAPGKSCIILSADSITLSVGLTSIKILADKIVFSVMGVEKQTWDLAQNAHS